MPIAKIAWLAAIGFVSPLIALARLPLLLKAEAPMMTSSTWPGGLVCVFFTLNRYFYPSTSSTTSIRTDSSILEEIHIMWSQSYATEILRCHVCRKHSSGCDTTTPVVPYTWYTSVSISWSSCRTMLGDPEVFYLPYLVPVCMIQQSTVYCCSIIRKIQVGDDTAAAVHAFLLLEDTTRAELRRQAAMACRCFAVIAFTRESRGWQIHSSSSSGWRLAMPRFYRSTVIVFGVAIETAQSYVSIRRDTIEIWVISRGFSLMIPRGGPCWKFVKSDSLFTDGGTAGNCFYTTAARIARSWRSTMWTTLGRAP